MESITVNKGYEAELNDYVKQENFYEVIKTSNVIKENMTL